MDFLKRYVHDQYSTKDLANVKDNLGSEKFNEAVQKQMKHHWWNLRTEEQAIEGIDFDSILHKIHHSINLHDSKKRTHRRLTWENIGKVAAVVLLPLLVASTWATLSYQRYEANNRQFVIIAPQGQQSQITLSDGTTVWLNSASELMYTGGYGKTNREIKLVGEGYFSVAKNKDLPFQVSVKDITVTAIGTSFNVDAYKNQSHVKVTLVEGKVKVSTKLTDIVLTPGHQLVADGSHVAKVQKVDTELYTSWHQGIIVFKDELLEDILQQLEKRYDVTFVLKKEELKSFRYRGSLRLDYSILKTLEILHLSTGINYQINGRTIELEESKKGISGN